MSNFNMPFSEIINLISDQVAEKVLKNLNPSNSSTEDIFMNIEETAKLIDLSVSTVYGLVHKNKIFFHKKGKRLYFLKSEILDWIKSGKKETTSALESRANEYLSKNKLF
ncbi:helix-turn-helix domain-containing protein [Flavobacterium sp. K77]|uniref:helix-turn-helix domain-containing protein n=1 Tax=Flavobacterium sp. K77 TaxID=2910676 RepID=UPI001F1F077E|nr:helix-turn-helix domain-containing protein [Flavobacterium sp. K77]MCF6142340.1 helix-turn-helix domain-containing protein [Flavobacterium sp. K77]